MQTKHLTSLLLSAALAWLAPGARAAISVTSSGAGPLTFNALPTVADGWSTLTIGTAATTYTTAAGLDGAVNTLNASSITTALGSSATLPPSQNGTARWNSAGLYLQTRPTGNDYLVLMATLQNNAGGDVSTITVSYNWDQKNSNPVSEDIPGHRAFYSLTGAPGTWVLIPEFSVFTTTSTAQTLTATLHLGTWVSGTSLYLLWADDNGPGSTTNPMEGAYTIDDLSITSVVLGGQPPAITRQPAGTNVNEYQTATLSAGASSATSYQWYKNGNAIPNANAAIYVVTNTPGNTCTPTKSWSTPGDSGTYWVVVTGSIAPTAESDHVQVTVNADATAPTLLYAVSTNTSGEFILHLSEALDDSGGAVSAPANWSVLKVSGQGGDLGQPTGVAYNQAARTITLTGPYTGGLADSLTAYRIETLAPMHDLACTQNALPSGSSIGINSFETELVALNHTWRFDDTDQDPAATGGTWSAIDFPDGSWASAAGPFDAKRNANGVAGSNCRDTSLYSLGAVGHCLNLTSPVTLTNLITSYFRTHFTFAGTPGTTILRLNGKFDDGAVVYLNGVEIERIRLAAAPAVITHTTLASTTVNDTDAQDTSEYIYPAALQAGDNVLAVELHQINLTSSDLTMGLRMVAVTRTPATVCSSPTMSISMEATHVRIKWVSADCGQLQYKDNLEDAAWTAQGATDQVGPGEYLIPLSTATQRFYSVRQ